MLEAVRTQHHALETQTDCKTAALSCRYDARRLNMKTVSEKKLAHFDRPGADLVPALCIDELDRKIGVIEDVLDRHVVWIAWPSSTVVS